MQIERAQFEELFRDLLNRLHDYPALEKHPLTRWMDVSVGQASRGEQLSRLVFQEIENLQQPLSLSSEINLRQRPYLILHKRYVEGKSPAAVSSELFIGERQLRRDHNRAVDSLIERYWNHHIRPRLQPEPPASNPAEDGENPQFASQSQQLELNQIVRGVADTLQKRYQNAEAQLELALPPFSCHVLADRVILRQILIGILNLSLRLQTGGLVKVQVERQTNQASISIEYEVDPSWDEVLVEEFARLQSTVLDWLPAIRAQLAQFYPAPGSAGNCEFKLELPLCQNQMILVVDDQQPTVRMFQRYLSQTNYQVIGIDNPEQVIGEATRLQPYAITLDVMMPQMDGWELLQALKLDPHTKTIPVLVCSALNEPELARSLGAASFLKKPIMQKDLLTALQAIEAEA